MERPSEDMRVLRFGPFEVNFTTGELCKHGIRLKLQDQPFHVLKMLLARPGELVTREEIRQALWPSGTFVDFDNGLNAAINRLREGLGDSAELPRFIETLPRRGYRFIGAIDGSPIDGSPQTGVLIGVQPAATAARWRTAKSVGLGLLILGFVVSILVAFNVADVRRRLLSRGAAPHIESLAVLPLQNLSGDKEQDYFVEGLTEELITNLAKISSLKVISRTSVMQYKDTKKPLPQIAKELDVEAVVEGSVLLAGKRVRISAQLIQASSDRHLWAETYDRDLRDILTLQSDIAAAIGNEVRAKLTPQDQRLLANARSVNPEAYQAYLKGKYYTSKWNEEGFKKAVASFRQSIDVDPAYAPAYGGLGEVYSLMALWALQPSTEIYPLAKAAALKALQLDDGLAEAHADLGLVKFQFDWDWSGGEQELKRAVTLNPSSSSAHLFYGLFLTAMGRADESVKETRIALELDPLTPSTNVQLGWVLYYARRHDESIAQLKKALELAPDFGYANMELGWNYAQKHMYPEAVTECRRAVSLAPEDQVTLGGCGNVYGLAAKRQNALALLEGLKKLSRRAYVDPYNMAWLYDGLGDNNPTMQWLERAYVARSASLPAISVEVWSDRLRSDPRFEDLLRRMNFPK